MFSYGQSLWDIYTFPSLQLQSIKNRKHFVQSLISVLNSANKYFQLTLQILLTGGLGQVMCFRIAKVTAVTGNVVKPNLNIEFWQVFQTILIKPD